MALEEREKESSVEPYSKEGTRENPLLLFNKHGRSAKWMIGESIYSY